MMSHVFRLISRALNTIKAFFTMGILLEQDHRLLADQYRRQLLLENKYGGEKGLNRYEKKVFSQNGEDGIIEELFRRIGDENRTFVEIGSGDGSENNTAFLLLKGWKGSWIEGSNKEVNKIYRRYDQQIASQQLTIIPAHVTKENIFEILKRAQIPNEFDLLSIDVDQNTYWIWAELSELKPRVVVIEYNSLIPPDIDWKVKYDSQRTWDGSAYFGASLKAYELLGTQFGYRLVGCDLAGVDAFFVRGDLTKDRFEEPFIAEHHYEPPRQFLREKRGFDRSIFRDLP
jgi:hypothetical protein